MSGLTIYRASAGSGKTYTLARDFISLVMQDPGLYKHILAVTFTNKATDEMKSRILDELYKLSGGKPSPMLKFIASENNLPEQEIAGRAEIILGSILHNYSRFHIETIDRFFQRAIRAFTKEIGLSGGYEIELDSEKVLSGAIDDMLVGLDKEPELLKWFVEFARDKVQEGKHWNLKNDLMVLGKELNRERFQMGSPELIVQISDKQNYAAFQEELMKIKYSFENTLKEIAGKAVQIMESEGLQAGDFKGQYGLGYFFTKILQNDFRYPSNTILKALDEPLEWYSKGSQESERILSAYHKGMNVLLSKCIELYEREYINYNSAESVRSFLYTLGILTDISAHLRAWAESQGIFLLSDAARFLHGIIGENDVPFIYEKVGNYFHHFMIDEFQDTSGLQWKNFKPLIENSLAYNRKCLVVGDVKQSIYRWRNSDWEILSEHLPREFSQEQLEIKGLRHNWRSLRNIVEFNNGFFREAREMFRSHFNLEGEEESRFSEKIARAYSEMDQEVPDEPGKEGGYIHVSLIPDTADGNWKDMADHQVIGMIERLQVQGIKPSEIAILVRSKRDGKRIADAILEYKSQNSVTGYIYDVISNESLYLYNALSVRIIVAALKYLLNPENQVNLAQLVYEYNVFAGRITGSDGQLDSILGSLRKGLSPSLPEDFMDDSLRYLTLTELTERIIALFSLNSQQSQTPYILGFQDLVLDYCRGGGADINSFLNWWDEYGEEKSLTVSEDQDAIQVMTIHKAKGLEFRAVIIPYCNWAFDHRSPHPEILWCSPTQKPFNKLSLLPVRYSSSLKDTIFEQDYLEEKFRVYMDHLNLLYVAFTRARESLIVFAPEGKEDKFSDVSGLLKRILKTQDLFRGAGWDNSFQNWTLGEFSFPQSQSKIRNQILLQNISSHEYSGKLRLMYRGIDFFDTTAEQKIHYGNLMHEIFSRISSVQDIDRAIHSVRREGFIDSEDAERLKPEISGMLDMEQARNWFDGSWKVIAEQDILTRDGSIRRPDRVMLKMGQVILVDYKFGKQRSAAHLIQVRKYANMLGQMNYRDVSAYIWYVNQQEVVEA